MADLKENLPQPQLRVPMSAEDFRRRRLRSITILIALGVLAIVAASWIYKKSTDPLRARESYDAGDRLYKEARYAPAILALDQAIALAPDYADAYLLRARASEGNSDLAHAIEDLTSVIRLRPNDPLPYLERGLAYLEVKNYQASLDDSNKAIALNPKLAAAYNLRATLERARNDPHKALEDFTRAVELSPNLDNYYQRGATYQSLGEHQKAIDDFSEAILINRFNAQALFARAQSKRALGDIEGAKQDHLQGRLLDGR